MIPEISKKEKVAKHVDKLIEAQELRHSKYYSWIKNIITLAIGFLGIISFGVLMSKVKKHINP